MITGLSGSNKSKYIDYLNQKNHNLNIINSDVI